MYKVWRYKLDHVAFWLITLVFYAFTRRHLVETSGWLMYATDVLIRNMLIAAACYLNIYLLFERFFKRRLYLYYFVSLLFLLVTYTALQSLADRWQQQQLGSTVNSLLYHSYYHFSVGLFYISFTLALELSKRWYRQELLLHKMESEKLNTELQYLKAQLNPHFLFNCINTIYFQIDEHNSEARESLRKFSEMLRYQLYECNEEKIPIEKEMSYLESYVDLQRLRKDSNNKIHFGIDQQLGSFKIAPLLLLPFVENAFKHLSTHPDSENVIDLTMSRRNGSFVFSVMNSVDDEERVNPAGIGLKNVQRRLDLLYPGQYQLDIKRTPETFTVKLELEV